MLVWFRLRIVVKKIIAANMPFLKIIMLIRQPLLFLITNCSILILSDCLLLLQTQWSSLRTYRFQINLQFQTNGKSLYTLQLLRRLAWHSSSPRENVNSCLLLKHFQTRSEENILTSTTPNLASATLNWYVCLPHGGIGVNKFRADYSSF